MGKQVHAVRNGYRPYRPSQALLLSSFDAFAFTQQFVPGPRQTNIGLTSDEVGSIE